LGEKWVLLISPHRSTEYFVGSLDLERVKFTPEMHGALDPGATYASNISRDAEGRTLLWLWGKTDTKPAMGWNGCMAMPRVLSIDGSGMLRQTPAAEFAVLRGEARAIQGVELAGNGISIGDGDCVEIQATFTVPPANAVGLRIGGKTEIVFDAQDGVLSAGGARKRIGATEPLRLRVFIDRRVIEVFANDGEAAIFTTSESAGSNYKRIEAFARGGIAHIDDLRVWPMKAAQMSLDHFKV
jgi:beta-fructofuranosidase